MKKIWILILAVLAIWAVFSYNSLVKNSANVSKTFAAVESAYQRRTDLIPNLVNTVKGVANFEQKTLTDVINARASATQTKLDPSNMTQEDMDKFQQAQSGVGGALGRLLVVAENYPVLKATDSFRDLQVQLEGTENRIKVERDNYSSAAADFNAKIKSFPTILFNMLFRFKETPVFKSEAGADKVPTVTF